MLHRQGDGKALALLCPTIFLLTASVAPGAPVDAQTPAVPPPAMTRLGPSNVTVRAVRIATPLTLDGRLDEEPYSTVEAIKDFIQQEPREGEPATEKTETWIFFDDTTLYISARCWDSHPEREVANELRRDNSGIVGNENFTFVLDTFHDRRNGFFFQANPLGALRDLAVTDDLQNVAWNGIWFVKTGRFEQGWTVEFAIPFKTLRYAGSGPQDWGINLRRLVKWKNELSYVSLVPAAFGLSGMTRMTFAANLVGLETPSQSMNLELKPYGMSSITTDKTTTVPSINEWNANAGFDFKYGLTRGLIADATVNTDFAQIEEDLQQVNLTRFSLFFPEKRDFFVEGQGIFDFGGVQANSTPGDVPLMFFSRQIGLSQGQSVPVIAGGRVTGKIGRFSLGALDIQTADKPAAGAVSTNFTALRIKREFLRRSNVGLIATRRSPRAGGGVGMTIGVDTTMLLFKSVYVNSYYAMTPAPGVTRDHASYRGRFEYAGDRYGLVAEHLLIGPQFVPDLGYARRTDFRRNYVQGRFSPRTRRSRVVRKLTWQGSLDYVTDAHVVAVQNRETRGTFIVDLQNSDQFSVDFQRDYELLPKQFTIAPGVVVPAGGYVYNTSRVSHSLGQQRKVSGRLSAWSGTLYNGTETGTSFSGRLGLVPRLSIEPNITLSWVALPYGDFTARVVSARFTLTPSARMMVSSLVQYNATTHTVNSSARLRWEYAGGSELFLVYSDGRNTLGFPDLLNKSLAVKVTRLIRF